MIQSKRIIIISIRNLQNAFAVFRKTYPCIAKVISVLVNIAVFSNSKPLQGYSGFILSENFYLYYLFIVFDN